MTSAANSLVAKTVTTMGSSMPPSFNGDRLLFGINLALSTIIVSLAIMVLGLFLHALWEGRRTDRWRDPVTIWRISWACAATALGMRAGVEMAELLAWSPNDPELAARVMLAKRLILPASTMFTATWMTLVVLARKAIEGQLRRQPLPVPMMKRLPVLKRPAAAVAISLVMAVGVVWTRG